MWLKEGDCIGEGVGTVHVGSKEIVDCPGTPWKVGGFS